MSTRVLARQRYPENTRAMKVVRSYEEYAGLEAELNETPHIETDGAVMHRVVELKQESIKTVQALKDKQPVRIPERKALEINSNVSEDCTHILNT